MVRVLNVIPSVEIEEIPRIASLYLNERTACWFHSWIKDGKFKSWKNVKLPCLIDLETKKLRILWRKIKIGLKIIGER